MESRSTTENYQFKWRLAFVALVASCVYIANFLDFFISDDFVTLFYLRHPGIKSILDGTNTAGADAYRPLALLHARLMLKLAGLQPWIFHLAGGIWHAACAVLISLVTFQISSKNRMAALAAGFVFAVYPAHVENVAYISGAPVMASTALALAAIYFQWNESYLPRLVVNILVFLLCIASALFHESGYIAPFLCLCATLCHRDTTKSLKDTLRSFLAPFAAAVLIFVIRASVESGFNGIPWRGPIGLYMARNVMRYLQIATLPLPFDLIHFAAKYKSILFPAILAVVGAVGWILRKRFSNRTSFFIFFMFAIGCLPFCGHFPRMEHMPMMTCATSAAAGILLAKGVRSRKNRRMALAAFAAWIVLLSATSASESIKWHRASTFTERLVKTFPRSALCGPKRSEVIVLCTPDSLNGAFVLRNGLFQALRLFGPLCPYSLERYMLAGIQNFQAGEIQYHQTDTNTFEISLLGRNSGDYLLLPDARMDRHLSDIAVIGPVGYRIIGEDRPYFVDAVELKFDPDMFKQDIVKIIVYENGLFKHFESEFGQ